MVTDLLLSEIAAGHGRKVADLAPLIPRGKSAKLAYSTIWRWILSGVRRWDGQRVYLEAVKSPSGGWISTPAAIGRYLAALTPAAGGQRPRSAASRRAAAERAERELEAAGI